MLRIFAFLLGVLVGCPSSFAANVCVVLNGGGTAIVGNPFPLILGTNDCSQYPNGTTLLSTADSKYTAWAAVYGPNGSVVSIKVYNEKYQQQLAKGIAVTSSSLGISGVTFPIVDCQTGILPYCSLVSEAKIAKLNNTQVYAYGSTVVPIYDVNGTPHNFTRDNMIDWGDATSGYLVQCSYQAYVAAGNTFPANSITLAH